MSENAGQSKTTKVATVLFLLANYLVTVNAAPLGTAEMTVTRFYWLLLIVVLAILSLIYMFSRKDSPIEVVGLTYDKSTHQLELTVRNKGEERYCIKSALRMLAPAQQVIKEAVDEGNIPMATAQASVGNRNLFQLLCEDEAPVQLEANETRTLTYDIMMPQEFLNLDSGKDVEVHISYGEDLGVPQPDVPQLDAIPENASERDLVAESFLLEDLLQAIANSPDETVSYHMENGNDFAHWVKNVLGDEELAAQLEGIQFIDANQTRKEIVETIDSKLEAMKHPYLRKVGEENKFVLKSDHDSILSETVLLEELSEALANSDPKAVSFHMKDRNDFADWVANAVGDEQLASELASIKYTTDEQTRDNIVSAIRGRVDTLKS